MESVSLSPPEATASVAHFFISVWRLISALCNILVYEIWLPHLNIPCYSTNIHHSGHVVSLIKTLTIVLNSVFTVSFGAVIWWCNTDIQCLSQRMHNFTFHRLLAMEQKLCLFFGKWLCCGHFKMVWFTPVVADMAVNELTWTWTPDKVCLFHHT